MRLFNRLALGSAALAAILLPLMLLAARTDGTPSYAADDYRVLMADGRILVMTHVGWVEEANVSPAPVPANQVAYFGGLCLIDTNGNGWVWDGPWVNIGPPPGGQPIAVQETSWSQIKTKLTTPTEN